mgnify:CR=1 FL=1
MLIQQQVKLRRHIMSSIICLLFGLILGFGLYYLAFNQVLIYKDKIIEDYKKGIEIHNQIELKLTYINQSTKDYVKKQQDILKAIPIKVKEITDEASLQAGRYMALKEIERTIIQLEKNSESLVNKK